MLWLRNRQPAEPEERRNCVDRHRHTVPVRRSTGEAARSTKDTDNFLSRQS
jgi:hypothetical protein